MPKARMLVDHRVAGVLIPCNAVPDLPKDMVASLKAGGIVDPSPAAVAYALTLGIEVPAELEAALAPEPEPQQPAA